MNSPIFFSDFLVHLFQLCVCGCICVPERFGFQNGFYLGNCFFLYFLMIWMVNIFWFFEFFLINHSILFFFSWSFLFFFCFLFCFWQKQKNNQTKIDRFFFQFNFTIILLLMIAHIDCTQRIDWLTLFFGSVVGFSHCYFFCLIFHLNHHHLIYYYNWSIQMVELLKHSEKWMNFFLSTKKELYLIFFLFAFIYKLCIYEMKCFYF